MRHALSQMAGSADNAARFMRTSLILASASLVAIATMGAIYWRVHEPRSPIPAAAAAGTMTSVAAAENIDASTKNTRSGGAARLEQIALAIERALLARNPQQRETAFTFLLPELLELDPARVVHMVARYEPGEVRDSLRDEVVRLWIVKDRNAAIEWMGSLENEAERKASALIAVRTVAASSPAAAIELADQFGVGRDDGSLEHLVQIWATEKPDEAMRWLDSQPAADPRTAQLRARIDQVRTESDLMRK